MISSMVHIFPVQNVQVDPLAAHERFVVCVRDQDGTLRIMGLRKYLTRRSRASHSRALLNPVTRITAVRSWTDAS